MSEAHRQKRRLVRLSTGEVAIADTRRPDPVHPERGDVFHVRVRGRLFAHPRREVWPDYDVQEVSRLSWWLARWLGG